MEIGIVTVTVLSVIASLLGCILLSGEALKTVLFLAGALVWFFLTYAWWATRLLDKFIKK